MNHTMNQSRLWVVVALLCLCLYVPGLWSIPALDRDEARFAQASKQMLESGDYANIHFQEEPRNKKPVGAYWAQTAVVNALMLDEPYPIWGFRIPSIIAAVGTILLLFAWARHEWNLSTASMATAFLMSSLCLVMEAHQAKTDALLLFTITLSQLGLYRVWMNMLTKTPQTHVPVVMFWLGLGVGILIKGPVAPAVVGLTLAWLLVEQRKLNLLWQLRPALGVAVVAAILAPWIIMKGAGFFTFLSHSWNEDIAPKIVSGQESHGAPPLYYMALMPFFFWPASTLIIPCLAPFFREIRTPSHLKAWYVSAPHTLRFLVAWIVPAWVLFEVAPTKLPHYTLPTYPALALFAAYHICILRTIDWRGKAVHISCAVGACIALILGAAGAVINTILDTPIAISSYLAIAMGLYVANRLWLLPVYLPALLEQQRDAVRYGVSLMVSIIALYALIFQGVVPSFKPAMLSKTIAQHIHGLSPKLQGQDIAAVGFMEPSLVFELGTKVSSQHTFEVAPWLKDKHEAMIIVDESQREALLSEPSFAPYKLAAQMVDTIHGYNYSRGKFTTLTLYHYTKQPAALPIKQPTPAAIKPAAEAVVPIVPPADTKQHASPDAVMKAITAPVIAPIPQLTKP